MGNGVGRRYKKIPEGENPDHHAWRAPKLAKKTKNDNKPAAQTEASNTEFRLAAASNLALAPAALPGSTKQSAAGRGGGPGKVGGKGFGGITPSPLDDDDEDLAEFGNLANAAAKVWEDLMGAQKSKAENVNAKDFKALFYLGELKDSVERAAKRAEALRREANNATVQVTKKQEALEKLCKGFEDRAGLTGSAASWKLGDIALRRGKGLSEISMVHHEADPPYFEVRMVLTGQMVGTEASNLIPMTAPQQAMARGAMRELDQAKTHQARIEEAVVQAAEDLKKQHETLTAEVEKKMMGGGAADDANTAATPPDTGAGPSLTGSGRHAPAGLPDLNLIHKWSGPHGGRKAPSMAPGPALEAQPAAAREVYPDMRGTREDLRGPSPAAAEQASPAAPQPTGPVDPSTLPTAGSAPGAPGRAPPSAPMGFPSLDELNKLEQQAAERERAQLGAAHRQVYPGVHESAKREAVSRPADDGSYRRQQQGMQFGAASDAAANVAAEQPAAAAAASAGVPPGFPTFSPGQPAGMPPLDPRAGQQQRQAQQSYLSGQAQQSKAQAQAAEAEAAKLAEAERLRQAEAQAQAEAEARAQAAAQAAAQARAQASAQAQAQAAAQPSTDWVMYRTENGEIYYHNERTNETAWTLPVGMTARDPTGASSAATGQPGTQAWYAQQQAQAETQRQAYASRQAEAQAQAQAQAANDPWAGLRQHEDELRQQREQWAQWYQQYSAWYQQTAQAGAGSAQGAAYQQQQQNAHTSHGAPGGSSSGAGAQQKAYVPPKGPQPPKLDANFEDQAVYAMKNAVLKEMEAMLEQGEPVAKRKKALRCLQIQWHPDKNPDKEDVAKSVFQFIEETKEWFLHDPDAEDAPS